MLTLGCFFFLNWQAAVIHNCNKISKIKKRFQHLSNLLFFKLFLPKLSIIVLFHHVKIAKEIGYHVLWIEEGYHTKPQGFFASHVLLQIFTIIWPPRIDIGYNTSMISKELISSVILIKVVPLSPAQSVLKICAQMMYF